MGLDEPLHGLCGSSVGQKAELDRSVSNAPGGVIQPGPRTTNPLDGSPLPRQFLVYTFFLSGRGSPRLISRRKQSSGPFRRNRRGKWRWFY